MERFTCPRHGRLVADLFLGRLGDAEAAQAERALVECEACASSARATDEAAAACLDAAVAAGFAQFEAPRRVAGRWWLQAAAAAAIVTVGVGVAWWKSTNRGPSASVPELSAAAAPSSGEALTHWSFEDGSVEVAEAAAAPAPPRHAQPRPASAIDEPAPLPAGSFESGDLSGWSSHT